MKKTIIIPTDFSELSDFAVEYAFTMTRQLGGKMIFLHSLDWANRTSEKTDNLYIATKEQASTRLDDLVQRAESLGLEAEARLTEGPPFLEIIRNAKSAGADLVIMGTHGRTGLSYLLMGSQAEKVVREAPCAVVIVKRPTPPPS